MLTELLTKMSKIRSIKKVEVALPIARKAAYVDCLFVGDDLSLRTSVLSPAGYDKEMTKLLYDHTEIQNSEEEKPKKPNFERFKQTLSNNDKVCLIWGLYKSTYDTLGERTVVCSNESCGNKTKHEILLDDLVHEDTFTIWPEEKPFHEHVFTIEVEDSGYLYVFDTQLPSIAKNNRVLSSISVDTLQRNMENLGSPFSQTEQMVMITSEFRFGPSDGLSEEFTSSNNLQEMLLAFKDYVPKTVSEIFFEKYNDNFGKYTPKFYKKFMCQNCNTEITYNVDLEYEFFRRSLGPRIRGM